MLKTRKAQAIAMTYYSMDTGENISPSGGLYRMFTNRSPKEMKDILQEAEAEAGYNEHARIMMNEALIRQGHDPLF